MFANGHLLQVQLLPPGQTATIIHRQIFTDELKTLHEKETALPSSV